MRNLKKLFAVILTVAMLASIMVPALAADGTKYDADAQKLYDLGLFKGYSASDFGLGDNLTREQGLTFMLRASGLEAEALAMSAEEIAAQFAKVLDPETVTDWAKPYVAYAVKNGLTKGTDASTLPNITFKGQNLLTGKEFINFMLNAMGYSADWAEVLSKAAEVGMLSAGEAVTFGTTEVLTRDSAVGIMVGALGGITADGVTLAQALVDAGAVDADAMAAAGFFAPTATPEPTPVALTATASADNLIQVYVVYSQEVDATSAKKADNYTVAGSTIADVALKDDGVTVVLTLAAARDQQAKADVTIKNIVDLAGTAIDETTINVEFFDKDIPVILDVSIVGKDTFKVVFSEPMKEAPKSGFVVNDGKLYVKNTEFASNNTVVYVTMFSTLKEGEVKFAANANNKDYAGFSVASSSYTLNVVPDTEAPEVIGYEDCSPLGVTLIWSEDIVANSLTVDKVYHTNSSNESATVTLNENKMIVTFAEAKKLPEGTAYVYVLKDAIKDRWDNKNVQQMIQVEVVLDTTPPEVEKIEQDGVAENKIIVTYSENVEESSAKEAANYAVLKDGEEEDIISAVTKISGKEYRITFSGTLSGDYDLIVSDVEDLAGNVIVDAPVSFTITDKTKPLFDSFSATVYSRGAEGQMVKVNFGEAMATEGKYAVNDLEKYSVVIGGVTKVFADFDDIEIDVASNNKSVEITIPVDDIDLTGVLVMTIARVADAAGNYTTALFGLVDLDNAGDITASAKATALDTVVIEFGDTIDFNVDDFRLSYSPTVTTAVYGLTVTAVETSIVDDKTVATYTILSEDADAGYALDPRLALTPIYVHVIDDESENVYGQKINAATMTIADKIKPVLDEDVDVVFTNAADSTIALTFNEALADGDKLLYAHDLVVKDADGNTLRPQLDYTTNVAGKVLTVTITGVDNIDDYSVASKDSITYITGVDTNKIATFEEIVNTIE